MSSKPEISIIILNYNTRDDTSACIRSVVQYCSDVAVEIIVVDNASTDGSVESIQKEFPQITVLKQETNTGYARGNNIGIKHAVAPVVLILNSDTYFFSKGLKKALHTFSIHKQLGVASLRILNTDKTYQVHGGFFPTPTSILLQALWLDRMPLIRKIFRTHKAYDDTISVVRELDWVAGTAMCIKKEVIAAIGGFSEEYFMYYEDVDYCLRATKAGYKIASLSECEIVHLGGASFGVQRRIGPIINTARSMKRYFSRHFPKKRITIRAIMVIEGLVKSTVGLLMSAIPPLHARGIEYAKAYASYIKEGLL